MRLQIQSERCTITKSALSYNSAFGLRLQLRLREGEIAAAAPWLVVGPTAGPFLYLTRPVVWLAPWRIIWLAPWRIIWMFEKKNNCKKVRMSDQPTTRTR